MGLAAMAVGWLGSMATGRATTWSQGTYPTLMTTYGTSGTGPTIDLDVDESAPPSGTVTNTSYPANYYATTTIANMVSGATKWTGSTTGTGGLAGGTGLSILLWANRSAIANASTSKPNGMSPPYTRERPFLWTGTATNPPYATDEPVILVDSDTATWYAMTGSAPGAMRPDLDTANWTSCSFNSAQQQHYLPGTTTKIITQQCRYEYGVYNSGTFKTALASNIVQTLWLSGAPAYALTTGTAVPVSQWGFMDVANAYHLKVYCFNDSPCASGGSYPSAITGTSPYVSGTRPVINLTTGTWGSGTATTGAASVFDIRVDPTYSVTENSVRSGTSTPDAVYLPMNRLADCWTDYYQPAYVTGSSSMWTYAEIVRDQGNLLPNDMLHYKAESYTDSLSGTNPANTTKPFITGTENGYTIGYARMIGISSGSADRLLEKDVIDVSGTLGSKKYALTVTGKVAVSASTGTLGNIVLQVMALDANCNYLGNVFKTFALVGSPTTDVNKQFSFTQTFASSTSTGVLAWPTSVSGTAVHYLRFNTMSNYYTSGSTGSGTDNSAMELDVSSLLVRDVTSGSAPAPTFWQCIASGTLTGTRAADGHTFTTFAQARAATGTANWQPQQLGLEVDYEVNDDRFGDATHDNGGHLTTGTYADENLVYLFKSMHDTLGAQGLYLSINASIYDPFDSVDLNNNANALSDENLDGILQNVDWLGVGAYGDSYCGNNVSALMGAEYYRLRYHTTGTTMMTGTTFNNGAERTGFSADKIGFQLELLNKNAGTDFPVANVVASGTTYKVTTVGANKYPNGRSVFLNGFAGDASVLNGKYYRVSHTGNPFTIDAEMKVSGTDPNGVIVVSATTLPSAPLADWGGGVVNSGRSSSDDYNYAVTQFIKNSDPKWQVKHWELIPNGSVLASYQNTGTPSNEIASPVTSLTVMSGSFNYMVIVTTSGAMPDTTVTFDHLADNSGAIADVSQLNGSTVPIDNSGANPLGGTFSGSCFALKDFNGKDISKLGYPCVLDGTYISGTAYQAKSKSVNRKKGVIAFGATP